MASLSFYTSFGASCRNEKVEGWAWASSLKYSRGNQLLDFSSIHEALILRHNNLKELLDEKGNLCVAQINFVLESNVPDDNSLFIVEDLPQNSKDHTVHRPLEKHVFLSGYDKPSVGDSVVKRTFYSDREREGHKKLRDKVPESKLRAFQAIHEVAENNDTKLVLDDPIIIHPSKPFFLDLEFVAARLVDRYKGIPEAELPLKAKLAMQWVALHRKDTVSFGQRLLNSRFIRSYQSHKTAQRINEWYRNANVLFPIHLSASASSIENTGKPESTNFFFTNNTDSEQRLFFYLDQITSYVDEYEILKRIIEDIRDWYDISGTHKARLVSILMNYCDTKVRDHEKMSPLADALESCPEFDPKSQLVMRKIGTDLKELSVRCSKLKKARETPHFRLLKLEEYIQIVQTGFDNLLEITEASGLGLKSTLVKKIEKEKQTLAKENETFFRLALRQHRTKNNTMKFFENDFIEGAKKDHLFESLLAESEFIIDEEITMFMELAQACLDKHPNMRIAAVVLNIHSTFDICYSCAPDLARESVRKDSFAEYFIRTAEKINYKKGRGAGKPFFRVVYSCSNVRSEVRCSSCQYDTKKEENPLWGRPSTLAFYQHYIENSLQEEPTVRRIEKDPSDLAAKLSTGKALNSDDDPDAIPADAHSSQSAKQRRKAKKKRAQDSTSESLIGQNKHNDEDDDT